MEQRAHMASAGIFTIFNYNQLSVIKSFLFYLTIDHQKKKGIKEKKMLYITIYVPLVGIIHKQ